MKAQDAVNGAYSPIGAKLAGMAKGTPARQKTGPPGQRAGSFPCKQ